MAPMVSFRGDVPVGNQGFWGEITSSIDWCELNYVVLSFVAEFWNSLSSFSMVFAGMLGVLAHRRVLETRFLLAFACVSVVGVGSVLFHASLKHGTQMLDELPMLYAAFTTTFILLENRESPVWGPWLAPLLVAHAAGTSLATFFASGIWQFVLFHVSFGSAEMFSLYRIYRIYKARRDGPAAASVRLLFRRGMASYAIGIAVWQFDLNNCWAVQVWWPAVSGLPNPQLHAWWHVFVSLGFYHLIALAALDRLLVLGRAPRLRWWAGLPVVVDAKGRD